MQSLATLKIQGLALLTQIGALPFEQHIKQTLTLDVELGLNIAEAAASDALEKALDYAKLAECLQQTAAETSCLLIETLSLRLQNKIISTYPQVESLKLCLYKRGAIKQAQTVAIEVIWNK